MSDTANRARSSSLALIAHRFVFLPRRLLLACIALYQCTLSPVLPAFFGPACGCRFQPSCSRYAAEAVQTHGTFYGTGLAILRLLKCTPLHAGGLDPVPPLSVRRPACTRVAL